MISRFTVYDSGSKAEDILHDGRTHEQFTRLMPESVRRNLAASSGYGSVTGDHHGNSFFPNPLNANTAIRITHRPILSGICNSGKYMPLQFLGELQRIRAERFFFLLAREVILDVVALATFEQVSHGRASEWGERFEGEPGCLMFAVAVWGSLWGNLPYWQTKNRDSRCRKSLSNLK